MKILIVDDESNVLKKLPLAFSKFFPEAIVDTAWCFTKAEELLKDTVYDIILLDGMLSEHRTDPWQHAFGCYLIEPIRNSLSCKAKIIMISTDEKMRKEGLEIGADLAISKKYFFCDGNVINSLDENFEVQKGL